MLLLQQLIKPIPFGSHDEADSHLAEKLGLRRRSLLCHAYGLPEAKRDVYSLFDTTLSLSGLPNSDEITLLRQAHLDTATSRRLSLSSFGGEGWVGGGAGAAPRP